MFFQSQIFFVPLPLEMIKQNSSQLKPRNMKQKVLFLMLLLLLGLAGGSVMAGEPVVERQAGMKIKPGNGIRPARLDRKELARQKGMRLDGKELDRMEKMPLKEASAGMKQRKDAPKRQAPTLITEQPPGELTTYRRSGGCISSSYFGISTNEQQGKFDVVINGTEAYIKNPSWHEGSYNTWVSGTYDAETGRISIPTGQYLYWNETNEYGIQMMWGSTSGENEGSESYPLKADLDENVTEICFQINEEAKTITLLDSEGNLEAEFPTNIMQRESTSSIPTMSHFVQLSSTRRARCPMLFLPFLPTPLQLAGRTMVTRMDTIALASPCPQRMWMGIRLMMRSSA